MELLGLSLTTWVVATFIALVIYYWYRNGSNHYWKVRNVPADRPFFNFGLLSLLLKGKGLYELDSEQYQKYGRLSGLYFGSAPMLMVAEPELLREILVKDFHTFTDRRNLPGDKILQNMLSTLNGEEWKRMRMIVSPVFTSGKMRKLAICINQSGEAVANSLLKSADSNANVELKRIFGGFTLDVIASTAFGTELDSINNPDNIFVTQAKKFFTFSFNWRLMMFVLLPRLMMKLEVGLLDPNATIFFSDLIRVIRDRRIKEGKSRDDFLQMLIDIELETANEDRVGHVNGHEDAIKDTTKKHIKKTLTSDELVAQCVLFFLAGYDTTATTISLVCYNLAVKPEIQERLLKEVDEMLEKHGKFDFDVVSSMKYLDAVVSESLRLYPPGTRLERKCLEDYELGDTGITIPKGMYVGVPVYAMHRDPEFFPDPDTFNPDRFLPENKDLIKPYTYLPFGAGPRNCVAMRFALMEVKLCLVNVLRHVSFHVCSETKVPLEFNNGSGLLQPKAVTVKVERRAH